MKAQVKQENVLEKSPTTSSIQNNEIIQVETNTNNPFNKILKRFNKIKKKIFLKFKQNDSIKIEEVYKKFEEKITSQSQSIESLKTRIEELETDSIVKDQNFQKLSQEFDIFKKESPLMTTPTPNKNGNNANVKKSVDEGIAESSTSQQSHKRNNSQNKKNINRKIHNQVMRSLNYHNRGNRGNTFKDRISKFDIGGLLGYEKTKFFKGCGDDTKKSYNTIIYELLKDELIVKKELSQQIKVYVDRELIPSLPSNVKTYNEFQNTDEFKKLSDEVKMMIMTVIQVEKKV